MHLFSQTLLVSVAVALVGWSCHAAPTTDLCLACMTTVESVLLLAREARRMEDQIDNNVFTIANMLCEIEYFENYAQFVRDGCVDMRRNNPKKFRELILKGMEAEINMEDAAMAKSGYFDLAKQVNFEFMTIFVEYFGILRFVRQIYLYALLVLSSQSLQSIGTNYFKYIFYFCQLHIL